MLFPETKKSTDSRFMSVDQVEISLREDDQVFFMFSSLRVEGDVVDSGMLMVCEFLEYL